MTPRVTSIFLACALLAASGALKAQAPAATQEKPWRTLLDRLSMDLWTEEGTADWRVVDDTVKSDGGNGYLVSADSFDDFELRAEFFVSPDANSGIFIRCNNRQEITAVNCYEVNIFDMRPDQTYRTGGIVNVAKVMANVDTGNKWNTMEITARGPRMSVKVNGMTISEGEDMRLRNGPIALQRTAGDVRFRRVQIR